MRNVIKALEDCEILADSAICHTPTGERRNQLTEINIQRMMAIEEAKDIDKIVRSSVNLIMDTVVELIGADGHQWSDRPCATCHAVTSLLGRPFGCYWYQKKLKERKST